MPSFPLSASRLGFAVLTLLLALSFSAGSVRAAEGIGEVSNVVVWAYGTESQQQRADLYAKDEVFANQLVETVNGGALHITFADDSLFRLGSSSSAVLDQFVYDAGSSDGAMFVSMLKGVFRFTSGKLVKDGVRLQMPVALIGIRGTDFTVSVGEDGVTQIAVTSGEVVVTPLQGGGAATAAPGQVVSVTSATADASVSSGAGPDDPGLQDGGVGSAGGNDGGDGGGDGGSH